MTAHAVLLVLFIFLLAWKEQIPPPEPIGMAINFGMSESGSGNIQPRREQASEQQAPQEEVQPEQPVTPPAEQVEATEPQEVADEPVESITEALQKEGPVAVEEKKQTVQEEVKQEAVKPVETPVEQPVEEQKEERKLEAVYTGPQSDKSNTSDSQGDKNTAGDQGSEQGQLDARTQYGGPGGGGGGFSHNLTGWGTDFSLPNDKPAASGKLEFKIRVDQDGDIVGIWITKRIGDSSVENFYKDYIQREMKFRRTQGGPIASFSEGTITLNLRVQ